MAVVHEYRRGGGAICEQERFEPRLWADRLVERFPHRPRVHVVLGDTCLLAKDEDAAIEAYRDAIRHANTHAKPMITKWWMRDRELAARDCVERDVCRAKSARVSAEMKRAVSEAWWNLAQIHMRRDDLAAAIAACDCGLEADRCCSQLQLIRAQLCELCGDVPGAIEALRTTTDLAPEDGFPWYRLGELLRMGGCHREAWRCFEQSAAKAPEVPLPWRKLAFLSTVHGEFKQGITFCRKAAKIDPDDACTWNIMAHCYSALGQGEAAIDTARRAIGLERSKHTWDTLGKAYAVAGRADQAIRCFLKSIALDWEHGEAWYGLGITHLHSGRPDKAREALTQLMRIDLAWAAKLGGEIDESKPKGVRE